MTPRLGEIYQLVSTDGQRWPRNLEGLIVFIAACPCDGDDKVVMWRHDRRWTMNESTVTRWLKEGIMIRLLGDGCD